MTNVREVMKADVARLMRFFSLTETELSAHVAKLRKRVRFWNYWDVGEPSQRPAWSLFVVPSVQLWRNLDATYRYRLYVGWLFWGLDVGFSPPPRVVLTVPGKPPADAGEFTDEASNRT